ALNIPPGAQRGFAFENLNNFDLTTWQQLRTAAVPGAGMQPRIHGSDKFGKVLHAAHENLAAAGVADVVELKQADVLEVTPPADHGVIVTNPPYGVRSGEQAELELFYPRWGDALKNRFCGWNAYILSADTRLPKLIGLAASRRTPLFNGALECRLYEYRLIKGSMKRRRGASGAVS
ncbi:MAG: THUMP domain-containing class I SAM-dependent RNA methyltransferase, partial [Burkholderiales bacterium]